MNLTGASVDGRGAARRSSDVALAALGTALGLAAMAVDHLLGDDPGLEDPPAFVISTAVVVGIIGLLFGFVLPRVRDAPRAGSILALASVLSLPLIWLGAPFAIAPAAIAVGRRGEGRRAKVAIAIGAAVLLLGTAAYGYDAISKLS